MVKQSTGRLRKGGFRDAAGAWRPAGRRADRSAGERLFRDLEVPGGRAAGGLDHCGRRCGPVRPGWPVPVRPRSGAPVPEPAAETARASNPQGTTATGVRDYLDWLRDGEGVISRHTRDGHPGLLPVTQKAVMPPRGAAAIICSARRGLAVKTACGFRLPAGARDPCTRSARAGRAGGLSGPLPSRWRRRGTRPPGPCANAGQPEVCIVARRHHVIGRRPSGRPAAGLPAAPFDARTMGESIPAPRCRRWPMSQPVVDASPVAVLLGEMDPLRSRLELEGDRVDHLTVVPPPATPPRRPIWK